MTAHPPSEPNSPDPGSRTPESVPPGRADAAATLGGVRELSAEGVRAAAAARGATGAERFGAGIAAAGCLSVLVVAAVLEPSAEGVGTHTQIPAMKPCHWLAMTGHPCPTCGMTTAFAHAAEGNYAQAFGVQPLGAALAIAGAAAFWISAHTAVTASRFAGAASRALGARSGWVLLAALILAWLYKIMVHA